jgi:hypothetical protein
MCAHLPIASCQASSQAFEPDDGNAERLTALAHEARILEFGLLGEGTEARGLASDLEGALTYAMDADSATELTEARNAIGAVLERLNGLGMRLTANLSEVELDGILGKARMPVLSAVLMA